MGALLGDALLMRSTAHDAPAGDLLLGRPDRDVPVFLHCFLVHRNPLALPALLVAGLLLFFLYHTVYLLFLQVIGASGY